MLYQIAIPVMMMVLPGIGANVPLCLGAIISAGLFGVNACVDRGCDFCSNVFCCRIYILINGKGRSECDAEFLL